MKKRCDGNYEDPRLEESWKGNCQGENGMMRDQSILVKDKRQKGRKETIWRS